MTAEPREPSPDWEAIDPAALMEMDLGAEFAAAWHLEVIGAFGSEPQPAVSFGEILGERAAGDDSGT